MDVAYFAGTVKPPACSLAIRKVPPDRVAAVVIKYNGLFIIIFNAILNILIDTLAKFDINK